MNTNFLGLTPSWSTFGFVLKSQIVRLLLSEEPIQQVLPKLERLFLDNPVSVRRERKVPRRPQSAWRSYHYQRNTRKSVF
jgi:hypothetical protein